MAAGERFPIMDATRNADKRRSVESIPERDETLKMADRLDLALRQIRFAREYTQQLIDDVRGDEWWEMPAEAPTHLAWQIGHLAMAQYGLALFRQRGRAEVDLELMSSRFRKRFSRGTQPEPDRNRYPDIDEIRSVLERVHQQVLTEAPQFSDLSLDEPIDAPYAAYATKFGALLFCSHHEMLHAGQIGLIRRLLGKEPIR